MRTDTFKSVLRGAMMRAAWAPDGTWSNIKKDQLDRMTEYINKAVRYGYALFEWPELVYDDAATMDSSGLIAMDATWDVIWRVFCQDPAIWEEPGEYVWKQRTTGLQVFNAPNGNAWVRNTKRPPLFDSTPWRADDANAIGDVRYYSVTGECYIAIAISTGVVPTDATKWTKLDMPAILSEAVKQGAAMSITYEKANPNMIDIFEASMHSGLEREWQKVRVQGNRLQPTPNY